MSAHCRIGRVRMKGGGAELRIFEQPSREPAADVVDVLRETLERAQSGELRAVAMVLVRNGRIVSTGWTGVENNEGNFNLLCSGAINLAHRLGVESSK